MQKISAYILAYNEAEKIKAAVETVLWADEIVVVDSNSTDGTPQIAESLGARVVQVPFNGFGDLRNRAIEACRHEWIFSLDSDERRTEAAQRNPVAPFRLAVARRLSDAAAQPHDGPPHPGFRLVSELSSTAALSQAPCATRSSRCTKAMSF